MRSLNPIPFAAVAALLVAVAASPSPANAGLTVNSATLNGGAAWTSGGGFTDGDPVTVAPGATIEVAINVTAAVGPPSPAWQSTGWDVDGTSACVDHADHAAPSTTTETFDITAPALPGTYNLVLTAGSNNNCGGQTAAATLVDAVIVQLLPLDATKELLDGPTLLDPAEVPAGMSLVVGPNDAGGIWVGLAGRQAFKYQIELTNQSGGTIVTGDGVYATDTVPGEYDLDAEGEDLADLTEDDICGDGTCDGITASTGCSVEASRAPGASEGNLPKLEPEFLTITVDDLDDGESCTVTVWVFTDGNPGHLTNDGGDPADDSNNEWSLFEPTSCRQIVPEDDLDDVGVPINDTIALNDGVKVFHIEDIPPDGGVRVLGPVGSLQLTANGCDWDGDGVQDLEDFCPLVGPEAGQVEDVDPGCWVTPEP